MLLFSALVAAMTCFTSHASFSSSGDPWLLTPGPITTSLTVKKAMLHDYGSRDSYFLRINRDVLNRLLAIANGIETHVAVPLQGSGTFIVEAMLHTLISERDCVLILSNGAYGQRMAKICEKIGVRYQTMAFPEDTPIQTDLLRAYLSDHPEISHVAAVYCETSTGMLNPIQEIARVVAEEKRKLLIDAMSAFGALPLDSKLTPFDAVALSSNKCLQGLPGCGFCIIRKSSMEQTKGNAKSLSLDLYDQWERMERTGQWRFTPPVQIIVALHAALEELQTEGGVTAREKRYRENSETVLQGMKQLGLKLYLSEEHQAPIIMTFLKPNHPNFDFTLFYNRLKEKGFVIYPGKLTTVESFRIGCIGDIHQHQLKCAVHAIEELFRELNINLNEELV